MSGGVDSSVAAYMIQQQGYDCTGITMKLFANEDIGVNRDKSCCSLEDVKDARNVADKMGIPFYVNNYTEDFKTKVIDSFITAYQNGATPNPCIDCNRYIKFNKLLLRARQLDMDNLVTGHYARIEYNPQSSRYALKKAIDNTKDQSYFLYAMTQQQLEYTLFPLGDMLKPEVRSIARKLGFTNAEKQDSQDICFVPEGDYGSFIEKYIGKKYPEGDILDLEGNIIGQHKGIIRYTLGQRRGVGVAVNYPVYVTAIDPKANTIILGDETALLSKTFIARDINLIAFDSLEKPLRCLVKTRYLQKEKPAIAEQTAPDELTITFDEAQRAITPGQAAVLYDGDTVIGGGTIV